MKKIDMLAELFDKKVVKIISIFLKNPGKNYSISKLSTLSKINLASTFRIVNKLLSKEIIKIDFAGKWKNYSLEDNEKTKTLQPILSEREFAVKKFTELVSIYPQIKNIILFRKASEKNEMLLLVGNKLPSDSIKRIASNIQQEDQAKLAYMELSEEGYRELKKILPLI